MAKDLQSIFEAITPTNIQDLDIIKDAMAIFIETLEELASESIDIKNIYENETIRQELIKIYLDDLYTVLKNIQLNQKLIEKIEYYNDLYGTEYFNTDVIYNLASYIQDEHFLCFRSFKESKGTEKSIKYIYDLINVFIKAEDSSSTSFELEKINNFNFKISGSMNSVFYNNIVRPLAHPMGFVYDYTQLITASFEDFFVEENLLYNINELYVVSLSDDNITTYYDYLTYVDEETTEIITRVVTDIKTAIESGNRLKYVYFDDGTYLKQVTDISAQTIVYYMNADDTINITFDGQSSIYVDYEYTFETTVIDELESLADYKADKDYWGRLDKRNIGGLIIGDEDETEYNLNPDQIGEFYLLTEWLETKDKGYNLYRDVNGNRVFTDDAGFVEGVSGRLEHYFAPDGISDVKMLSGSYEKNASVYNNQGEFVEIQKILYTDTVIPEYAVVENVLSDEQYIAQNEGNSEYFAREHIVEEHQYEIMSDQILLEPIFNGTINYIDYNDVDQGDVPDPWGHIGSENLYIGTGYDDTGTGMFINNMTPENGEQSPCYLEITVSGDVVNLQHETKDTINSGVYRNDILLEDNNYSTWID